MICSAEITRIFGLFRLIVSLNFVWIISSYLFLCLSVLLLHTHIISVLIPGYNLANITSAVRQSGVTNYIVIGLQVFLTFSSLRFAKLGGSLKDHGSVFSKVVFLRPIRTSTIVVSVTAFTTIYVVGLWVFIATCVLVPLGIHVNLIKSILALVMQVPLVLTTVWLSCIIPAAVNFLLVLPYLLIAVDSWSITAPLWKIGLISGIVCVATVFVSVTVVKKDRCGYQIVRTAKKESKDNNSYDKAPSRKFPSRVTAHCWFELTGSFWQLAGLPLIACIAGLCSSRWVDPVVCLEVIFFIAFSGVFTASEIRLFSDNGSLRTFCAARPMAHSGYASAIILTTLAKLLIPSSICFVFAILILATSPLNSIFERGATLLILLSTLLVACIVWKGLMVNVCFTMTGRVWVRPIFSLCFCLAILFAQPYFTAIILIVSRQSLWLILGFACLRVMSLLLLLFTLTRRQLVTARNGIIWIAIWSTMFVLTGLILIIVVPDTPFLVVTSFLIASLVLPGFTLSVPVAALEWNRRR